jgi:hypothetical protein
VVIFDKYTSPSTEKLIAEFIKNPNAKHVVMMLYLNQKRDALKRFMVKEL